MTTRQLLLIACGFITSSLCIHSSQEEPKIIFLLKQKLDMHIKELENAVINVEKIPEWESCINNKDSNEERKDAANKLFATEEVQNYLYWDMITTATKKMPRYIQEEVDFMKNNPCNTLRAMAAAINSGLYEKYTLIPNQQAHETRLKARTYLYKFIKDIDEESKQ